MNNFARIVDRMVDRHGVLVDFISVEEGAYDVETGTVVNTETTTSGIKAYPRKPKLTQFRYPDLIDKQVIEFIIDASDIPSEPRPMDKIVLNGDIYFIKSVRSGTAMGSAVIYKVLSYKS